MCEIENITNVQLEAVHLPVTTTVSRFSIMPDRFVDESFVLREVYAYDNVIRGIFDRTYQSEMKASPSHLTLVTAPLQTQKLFYIWIKWKLQQIINIKEPETLKIWPTVLNMSLPRLIRQTKDLTQEIFVQLFEKVSDDTFRYKLKSTIGQALSLSSEGVVYLIDPKK